MKPGLRTRIIIWTFVPTTIILLAVALVMFMAYQEATEELVVNRNQELVRLSAGQIVGELAEYTDRLAAEARTAAIVQGNPEQQQAALIQVHNRLAIFDGGVLVFDNFGRVVAADPPRQDLIGQDWSEQPFMRQMLLAPAPAFSDILASGVDGTDVIVVAVPILGAQNEFRGALAGLFQVAPTTVNSFYGDIVKLRLGRSGSAYLVDGRGRVIYHSDVSRIGDDVSDRVVVQQVLANNVSAQRTRDGSGRQIVASYAPVPGTPWGLVTQEQWSALSEPGQGYQRFLGLLLILGLIAPSLVVAFGIRRVTAPIHDLIGAAQEVAGGNFDQQIEVKTDDEIGELAHQFNHMAAQLQASYAKMEQKVEERTRELATLNAVAWATSQSLDLKTILSTALGKVLEVIDFELGVIYLRDPQTGELEPVQEVGMPERVRLSAMRGSLSRRAAETGTPVIVDDLTREQSISQELLDEGYCSAASIPLLAKQQVQGVLSAASRRHHTFRERDVDLLTSIGRQIGVAIENARLYETEQQRAEQFRVISEVGRSIASILVVDDLLEKMTNLIQQTFGYYHVGIGLVEGDELVFKAGAGSLWDDPSFHFVPSRLKLGQQGLSGWVAATGEALLAPDVSVDPRYIPLEGSDTRSELVLPIKAKGEVIGVLDVQKDRVNAFDEIEVSVLQSLANQAGVAIENARLYEQAQQLAVLEERQRLARDLHDSVTQALYGVTLYAEAAARLLLADKPDVAAEHLRLVRDTAREALAEMRLLIYELRPSILEEEGLVAALQARLESVEGRAGTETAFHFEDVDQLPPNVEEGLYWICQEVLNNALKHAKAQRVVLSLRCDRPQGRLLLEISDDGVGFDPEQARAQGGLGLRGVEERVRLLGGLLAIQSKPGQGTTIRVEIEVPADVEVVAA